MHVALAGLLALAVAMGVGRFAFTPILPAMVADGLVDTSGGGWLAAANYAGYFVGALTAMRLALPPRTALRAGLAGVVLSTFAMGASMPMAAWASLRFAAGVCSAWVLVFASAWSLERLHGQGAGPLAAAGIYSGVGVGIAFAGLACLGLFAFGAPPSTAWFCLGACAAIATAAIWGAFGSAQSVQAREHLAWNADTVRLVACYGAFGFGYIIPATFVAAMAREAHPDPLVYGWSWPAFGLAAAASTFAAARWAPRGRERVLWGFAQCAMATGVALPAIDHSFSATLACASLVGGTFMVVTMAGMQAARAAAPQAPRPLMAAMTAAFAAGQILGPLAVTFAGGAGMSQALALAATVLGVSAFAILWPRSPRP